MWICVAATAPKTEPSSKPNPIQSNPRPHPQHNTHTNHSQVVPAGGVDPEALAAQIVQRVLPLLAGRAAHRQSIVLVRGGGGGGRLLLRRGGHGGFGSSGWPARRAGVGCGPKVSPSPSLDACCLFFWALVSG